MVDRPRGPAHGALTRPEEERVDYLIAVSSLVLTDSHADEAELAVIRRLCKALDVSAAGEARALAAALAPAPAEVDRILERFSHDSALKTALLGDAIVVAFADGRLDESEIAEISAFASKLGVPQEQAMAIAYYVEEMVAAEKRGSMAPPDDEDEKRTPLSEQLDAALAEAERAKPDAARLRWLHRALDGKDEDAEGEDDDDEGEGDEDEDEEDD
jgi:uncharacterized tellurite resistance protein B-like protein